MYGNDFVDKNGLEKYRGKYSLDQPDVEVVADEFDAWGTLEVKNSSDIGFSGVLVLDDEDSIPIRYKNEKAKAKVWGNWIDVSIKPMRR